MGWGGGNIGARRRRPVKGRGVIQVWSFSLGLLLPSVSPAGVLESVAVEAASPGAVSLGFHFSEAAPEPRIFELAEPPRFVVDFPDTSLGQAALSTTAAAGLLGALIGAEDGSRSRFVLTVSAPAELLTTRVKRALTLTLRRVGSASPPSEEASMVEAVNFSATPDGVGELRIRLSKPVVVPAITENAEGLELRFPGVQVPPKFLGRSEVPRVRPWASIASRRRAARPCSSSELGNPLPTR